MPFLFTRVEFSLFFGGVESTVDEIFHLRVTHFQLNELHRKLYFPHFHWQGSPVSIICEENAKSIEDRYFRALSPPLCELSLDIIVAKVILVTPYVF